MVDVLDLKLMFLIGREGSSPSAVICLRDGIGRHTILGFSF